MIHQCSKMKYFVDKNLECISHVSSRKLFYAGVTKFRKQHKQQHMEKFNSNFLLVFVLEERDI